jgi:uncharacterized protein (UPF0335 family)
MTDSNEPNDDAIKYITMLTAFQVVLNCQLDLEKSVYLSGKSKQKVREAINILNLEHSKNHRAIWNIDSQKAASLMMGIEILAEEIAESNGVILSVIAELKRAGFDLSRVKIVEVSDEELEELENRKAG